MAGTGPQLVQPNAENPSGASMVAPPVIVKARPRAIDSMPSVATKAGTPNADTIVPLTAPPNAPVTMPAASPAGNPQSTPTMAVVTLTRPMMEPTDRSSPRPRTTSA